MKFNYTIAAMLCCATLSTGCSSDSDEIQDLDNNIERPLPGLNSFAPEDDAKSLMGSPQKQVCDLLRKAGPDIAKGYGDINITAEEAEEIKVFTDELVKDCRDNNEKFVTIFKWLYKNLEYKHEYEGGDIISNDPYPVFKEHVAICQGFSNLQHIMLESQGIPTINVNGVYVNVGGHAWNYVYLDDKWIVSDATNNGYFNMLSTGSYKHLEPQSIDASLFETEECSFNYYDKRLNVNEIKTTGSQFIVPYSAGGYIVTSLNPSKPVPTNVKEIYIGKNIKELGLYYRGLEKNAPSIEAAYVDPKNRSLESYSGAVYKKRGRSHTLYYIPAALKNIEFLPMKVFEKNTVFDHKCLEEVIIPTGTTELQDYAFEKCPNLKVAYVPEGVNISERAFWDVHPDFKVERKDLTGIPEIRI